MPERLQISRRRGSRLPTGTVREWRSRCSSPARIALGAAVVVRRAMAPPDDLAEGVVIERVDPYRYPRTRLRGGPSTTQITRYVVMTHGGPLLRDATQMMVVAP
jgi:hypothetical protein